jgi:hypothetical protein
MKRKLATSERDASLSRENEKKSLKQDNYILLNHLHTIIQLSLTL